MWSMVVDSRILEMAAPLKRYLRVLGHSTHKRQTKMAFTLQQEKKLHSTLDYIAIIKHEKLL